jgi:hypothetical protein
LHTNYINSYENSTKEEVKYKTELCRTWIENNYCPYNEKCRFAHGRKELHDKTGNTKNYKLKDCKTFQTKGFCPYGYRCQFKHDERKFNNLSLSFYSYGLELKKKELMENIFNSESFEEIFKLKDLNMLDNNLNNSKTLPVFKNIRLKKQFHINNMWNRSKQILAF